MLLRFMGPRASARAHLRRSRAAVDYLASEVFRREPFAGVAEEVRFTVHGRVNEFLVFMMIALLLDHKTARAHRVAVELALEFEKGLNAVRSGARRFLREQTKGTAIEDDAAFIDAILSADPFSLYYAGVKDGRMPFELFAADVAETYFSGALRGEVRDRLLAFTIDFADDFLDGIASEDSPSEGLLQQEQPQ